ncbi:endoglucanase 20-like [Aplysia californica]|uniref:cellulase n=1 Tax=Aplysia californica TaxID=6500 RepID=A0ABM1VY10_APLCA|nr:endoglucanase 20-like [Aplysia californica]
MTSLWSVPLLSLLVSSALGATQVRISEHWDGGFKGEPCVKITKELHTWKAHLQFSSDVNTVEAWNASPSKVSSREFILTNDWQTLHNGDQLCFIFIARTNGNSVPNSFIYLEGMDGPANVGGGGGTPSGGGGNTGGGNTGGGGSGSSSKKDYGIALGKSILFYDAQRSGKLPANNPIPWRGDSALGDCVTGGWYDAGDHVKFGLPMASSSTLLLWSLVRFKDGYVKAGQLDMMYDMIKWPLDYFLKAWNPGKQELVVQVGDGNADHAFWGRPEDMNMARPCKYVNGGTPGSDIAGETAAALAAGSIAFRSKGDSGYADRLLGAAKSLYAFAKSHRGVFHGSAPFYG